MVHKSDLLPASAFGKVAVLYGGRSAERDVSLNSGRAVHEGLCAYDIDAHLVDTATVDVLHELKVYDRAFIVLHGRGGEDGQMQALLDYLDIPYTGSGMAACVLGMDKLLTKSIWRDAGLPVLPDLRLSAQDSYESIVAQLGSGQFVVKPALEGSSVGVSKVVDANALTKAYQVAGGDKEKIMAEPWVEGRELTYAVLGERVLPGIEITASKQHVFYDYEAKYLADDTRYVCPAPIDSELDDFLRSTALKAFKALGAYGWGRVDYLLDDEGKASLLEINTVPGMTSHSLVPLAARTAGIDFETLVVTILQTTFSAEGRD